MAAVSSGMPDEAMTKMMPRDVPRRGLWLGFAIVIYKKYSAQPIGILGILKNTNVPGFRNQRSGSAHPDQPDLTNILFDS